VLEWYDRHRAYITRHSAAQSNPVSDAKDHGANNNGAKDQGRRVCIHYKK